MFEKIDTILLIEAAIVATIIVAQLIVFFRNNTAISQLRRIYPSASALAITDGSPSKKGEKTPVSAAQIELGKRFSPTFKEIVASSNSYLRKNPSTPDIELLQEIAASKDQSTEKAIEANISLPLYLGLLCTFSGVIIGLVKVWELGVNDQAITSFIGGVFIGMVGSALGLGLTVRSNYIFKDAKKKRDRDQFNYFAFLRTHFIPTGEGAKGSELSVSSEKFREDLGAFHEHFASYQHHTNESLKETLRLFGELKTVFQGIRNLETGLTSIGNAIGSNDQLLEKQVAYIDTYSQKVEAFTHVLNDHVTTVDGRLTKMVDESMERLQNDINATYSKMDQYMADMGEEGSKQFVDDLRGNIATIKQDAAKLQEKSIEINGELLKRIEQDDKINHRISQQMEAMNANLKQVLLGQADAKKSFTNSFGFKLFAVSGAIAFILAIAGGIAYTFMNVIQ